MAVRGLIHTTLAAKLLALSYQEIQCLPASYRLLSYDDRK